MPHRSLAHLAVLLCAALLMAAIPPTAVAAPAPAEGDAIPLWAPPGTAADLVPLHQGLAGRIVAAPPGRLEELTARGARPLDLQPGEALYVFLVEDGDRAEFAPPARVLLRFPREVVLATPGDAPRLTSASAAALRGLQQPVHVSMRAPLRPLTPPAIVPAVPREADPLVQQIVDGITETTYTTTWQILDDFETRYYNTSQSEQSSQWMLEQFQSYGLQAEFHIYSHNGSRRNVVATLPGLVDPTKVVYLTAHFDATSENPQVCAPGADDNASGTAAVLEAARVMAGFPFQYTVKFALFNSEEQGLIGSAAYVEDIAAAGEDVIAAYNMDMIAYRGSDPAPPDLIVYTNSASQAFATAVETAADTYVPGQIDVRVLVESMSSSDHSSFWDHGYRAVCAIEEEAWGSDFCPWYHTCDDRIERYPHDYPTACTKANVAAAAHAALPFSPDGPFLVVASSQVDDDASGGSQGNGDGALNPGETIELSVALQNVGGAAATGVTGELSTESPYVTLLQPGAAWPDIPSGGSASNAVPFRFQIDPGVPDGAAIPLTLEVSDQSGVRAFGLEFPVVAPDLAVCFYRIGEQLGGNGNGIIDPGEPVELTVRVRNRGGQDAAAVAATLSSLSGHLTVVEGNSGAVLIPSGQEAELDPPFRVLASAEALEGEVLELALGLETGLYAAQSGLKLKVGTSYYDEVEGETAWSLGAVGDDATSGLWIAADPVGTVYEGSIAQTEDDHTADPGVACFVTGNGSPGGAAGEQDVDGGKTTLVTPVFDLTHHVDPRVTYWRWYTNDLGNNPGQDTWLVQVSSDGGTSWVDLERTTSSENSWQQRSFALAGLITPSAQVVFRFVAEDLSPGTLVEAAIDDFEISGTIQTVAADDASVPAALRLDSPQPNPLVRGGAISFALPRAGEARVQLFNAGGRLARTLADGTMEAGMHRLAWDGLGNDRRPVPAGVYYLRLQAGEEVRTRSVVLAR